MTTNQNRGEPIISSATAKYGHLTQGGDVKITLTQNEACTVLKVNDYGLLSLNNEDGAAFNSLLAKLKDQIWA